ncbi:MAG: type II toxin-antitoxin system ParD family antitoxin [Rhodocyclaceae bacterium]|nr:type II toxin-antitoxin system ParD family antitoxin [Rhodocyclaceae bacterium]
MNAKTTSVALDEHFTRFVDAQVKSGHYDSASDVLRAGLRLLEENEAKVQALQQALIAGRDSGEPRPLDFQAFLKEIHRKHGVASD